MKKANLKKWVIEKETISNLSKFQQGMVLGGYGDEASWEPCWSVDNWTKCKHANCYTENFDSSCNHWTEVVGHDTCNG